MFVRGLPMPPPTMTLPQYIVSGQSAVVRQPPRQTEPPTSRRKTHMREAQDVLPQASPTAAPPVSGVQARTCSGSRSSLRSNAQESPDGQLGSAEHVWLHTPSRQRALAHSVPRVQGEPKAPAPEAEPIVPGSTHARPPLPDAQQILPDGHCVSSQHAFAHTLPEPPVSARAGTHAPSAHCADTTHGESRGNGSTHDPELWSHICPFGQLVGVQTPVTHAGGD